MFGIGLAEILVIVLVAIVFVKPGDLPRLLRRMGRLVRQLRDLREGSVQYLRRIEREVEEADREGPPEGAGAEDPPAGRQS